MAQISGSQIVAHVSPVVPRLLQVVLRVISILDFIDFLMKYNYFCLSNAFKLCVFLIETLFNSILNIT